MKGLIIRGSYSTGLGINFVKYLSSKGKIIRIISNYPNSKELDLKLLTKSHYFGNSFGWPSSMIRKSKRQQKGFNCRIGVGWCRPPSNPTLDVSTTSQLFKQWTNLKCLFHPIPIFITFLIINSLNFSPKAQL